MTKLKATVILLCAAIFSFGPAALIAQQITGSGGGTATAPGGANTNIQYNDSSAFGGDANLTWDKTNKVQVVNGVGVFGSTTVGDVVANGAVVAISTPGNASGLKSWTFSGAGGAFKFQRWTDSFGAPAATVWHVDNSITATTLNMLGAVVMAPGSDATHTDATLCIDASSGLIYKGSGAIGVCLGTSSARFKTDIEPLQAGLSEIMALEPVTYRYKEGYGTSDRPLYGFTAEQMKGALPQLVGLDKEQKPSSVDMVGIIPVLVQAIKEQQAEITKLKSRIQ